MQKNIEIRLRRETILNPSKTISSDFWLLFDSDINKDTKIQDSETVDELDEIFKTMDNKKRNEKLSDCLVNRRFLPEKKKLKSYWLPPVYEALSAPVKIFFNPSGKCPNSCLTCFAEDYHRYSLDDKVAEEVLGQILEIPIFWMNFGGCELSFYDNYFEFAERVLKEGIHVSTAISGVGLKREWAEKARNLGINIKVSLDGPKEINDIQRPGTYESALEAIKLFREIGEPVKINMVHTKLNNNVEIIDEMFEIAKEYGAKGIDISILRPKGGAIRNNLMIPFEDYENGRVKEVIDRFLNHPYIKKHNLEVWVNKNLRYFSSLEPKPSQALGVHCSCSRYSMGVNMDGSVDSCFFLPEEYMPQASVNDPKLFENPNFILNIWQKDETFRKVRELTSKKPCCPKCEKKGIDFIRGCPANAAYYGGVDPATLLH